MKHIMLVAMFFGFFQHSFSQPNAGNKKLAALFEQYTEDFNKLSPLTATAQGDNRYNDVLLVEFTDSHRAELRKLHARYLAAIKKFNRSTLNDNDKISYDIFSRDRQIALEGLNFPTNRIPFNQFNGLHTNLGQLGSGVGSQPFKTVKDYENWISRAQKFAAWSDSAIGYFKKGIEEDYVLPRALVVKMIPQLQALQSEDVTKSIFYGPVNRFPENFSAEEKARLTEEFKKLIGDHINPSYKKLAAFIENEYLPKARASSGIGALKPGAKLYDYYIRFYTTTNKTPDEVFNTGLAEVKRIRAEMEKVRKQVNFQGTLDSFFIYTKTNPKFLPYKTAEEVLDAFRAIHKKVAPHVDRLFTLQPKTPFEIRQTEAFRAASAAPQYNAGLPDGSRAGIFYVPIVDPKKITPAEECVFLHEAIPGHHFQIMLQRENAKLPDFRKNGGNSGYSEGWGLYCESLGKQLGCYTDPYQYFYALGFEMHRAIRLVTDAGIHSKGWTREQAIEYMRSNEPITEQFAVAEIERYMAMPGQALSYKVGELKIKELRDKYAKQLGGKFKLAAFHDEILKDGAMPLVTLEQKMNAWAAKQKK